MRRIISISSKWGKMTKCSTDTALRDIQDLIEKGIDTARIQAVGYGETVLLNKCINDAKCTEEEHRFNRRTEFKIIRNKI